MIFFLFNVLTFVILVVLHYYSVVIRIDNIAIVTPLHASGHYDVINLQWMLNVALTAPHNVPDQNYYFINWSQSGYPVCRLAREMVVMRGLFLVLETNCFRQPERQLPRSSYNHNTLKTLRTCVSAYILPVTWRARSSFLWFWSAFVMTPSQMFWGLSV